MRPMPRVGNVVDIYISPPGFDAYRVTTRVWESAALERFVPHLHRVAPDGRALIVADVTRGELKRIRLPITRALPQVETFSGGFGRHTLKTLRWLDNEHLVAHFQSDLQLLTLGKQSDSVGDSVFYRRSLLGGYAGRTQVEDVRTLSGGLMVRHTPRGETTRVEYLRTDGGKVLGVYRLDTAGRRVLGASVLSEGRIVVALAESPSLSLGPSLWEYRTDGDHSPSVIREVSCPGDCRIENWTPGTTRAVYALDSQDIIIETQDGYRVTARMDTPGRVTALWQSRDERRIVAANSRQLKMWSSEGTLLWSVRPHQPITSVHFARDNRRVIVGVGNQLRVYDETGYENAMTWREERTLRLQSDGLRFDDAIALPGGGHVFAVVDEDVRHVTW